MIWRRPGQPDAAAFFSCAPAALPFCRRRFATIGIAKELPPRYLSTTAPTRAALLLNKKNKGLL
jgi:hypothetical protein